MRRARVILAMTQKEMGAALGVARETISNWESLNKDTMPGDEYKLEEVLRRVRVMADERGVRLEGLEGEEVGNNHADNSEAYVPIHHVRVRNKRVEGHFELELEETPRPEFQVEQTAFEAIYRESPENFYAVTMIGDSMYPTVSAGETLMMQLCEGMPIVQGAVYMMTGRFGIRINRLRFFQDKIIVASDNPSYADSEYTWESFDEIFTLHMIARSVSRML